jgi:hypothetical protein
MRYYLPLRDKKYKGRAPSLVIPLWVWIIVIAGLLLLVLALR